MKIQGGNIFTENGTFIQGTITVSNERIKIMDFSQCSEESDNIAEEMIIDARGLYVLPGLVDIHMHGACGVDFSDAKKDDLGILEEYQAKHGITSIFPATMTLPENKLVCIMKMAADFKEKDSVGVILGITMEGPFLSSKKKGAQEEQYICAPDVALFKMLQKKSDNLICQVAVAPEEKGAMEFIREISQETVVSLAHSTADYETANKAFLEGATHVTHLLMGWSRFCIENPESWAQPWIMTRFLWN